MKKELADLKEKLLKMSQNSQTSGNTKIVQQTPSNPLPRSNPVPTPFDNEDEGEDDEDDDDNNYDEELEEEKMYQQGLKSVNPVGRPPKQQTKSFEDTMQDLDYQEFQQFKKLKEEQERLKQQEQQSKFNEWLKSQEQAQVQTMPMQHVPVPPQSQPVVPLQPIVNETEANRLLMIELERLNNTGLFRYELLSQLNRLNVNIETVVKIMSGVRV